MYDVAILGAGPGGYEAAYLAGKAGMRTALIEERELGGVCLNCGCIPLKSFLHVSKVKNAFEHIKKERVFDSTEDIFVNQERVIENKNKIVSMLRASVKAKISTPNIDFYSGKGVIENINQTVNIRLGDRNIESCKLVIATGSKSKKMISEDVDTDYKIIDSDEMLELKDIPDSLVIIGAGAVGIETASYFGTLGSSVVLIEQADHIGGNLDSEISRALQKILQNQGIKIFVETRVKEFLHNKVVCEKEKGLIDFYMDCVIMAVGREPNMEGLGLEQAGIECDSKGIRVNQKCETSNPLVTACGDVTGNMMLAHVAYRQAQVIIDNMIGKPCSIDYTTVPFIIYSNPEVASIGLSEDDCRRKGIDYISKTIPMTYSGRYFVENGRDGAIAKMIVDASDYKLLGFSMVGNYSSEIILAIEVMLLNKMTLWDMNQMIYPHPTVAEIIHELIGKFNIWEEIKEL